MHFAFWIISHIPFRVLYALSGVLFFITFHLIGYRRKVVKGNLRECFPEKNGEELKKLERKFYRCFIDNILETCKMGAMSSEEMSRRLKFNNIDAVNDELGKGRSIALYLGHFGNWEWISSMPIHLDKNAIAAQIYHRLSNPDFDRIILENRASHGAVNVEMRKTARFINKLTTERKVSIIGFIADQSPRKKDANYFVDFLHHSTPVLTGTEKITKRYGFEAWFVDVRKTGRGFYEAEFIKMHESPESLPDFELTNIYYRMLEQSIRRQPELYLWTHKRFRYAKKSDINQGDEN